MNIAYLKIYSRDIGSLHQFYEGLLGWPVKRLSEKQLHMNLGKSVLEFEQKEGATPYHYAIHIPEGQIEQARRWLKTKRLEVLCKSGEEIVDFPAWKAQSLYFYDPDFNIVELISRENYLTPSHKGFSKRDLRGIAEIGLATDSVKKIYDLLHNSLALDIYSGNLSQFCAIGDREGLFIVIDQHKKTWIPNDDPAFASDFEIEVGLDRSAFKLEYKEGNLIVI